MRLMFMVMLLVTTSCASPLSLRGARVLEPGEVEVIASAQALTGPMIEEKGTSRGFANAIQPELSVRAGVGERVDLQLRLAPYSLPEVSAGVQVLGEPKRDDDVAVTITAGVRPSQPFEAGYVLTFPAQLLVEVPMSDTIALTGGARVNTMIGVGQQLVPFGVSPGLVGGVRVHWGMLVVQPELGVAAGIGPIGVGYTGSLAAPSWMVASFGLNVGGQFEFTLPEPTRPPRSLRSTKTTPAASSAAPSE